MRFTAIISSILVGTCSAAVSRDPCTQLCDLIPGACSEEGSSCVELFCTDLYWMEGLQICNSSIPGCELFERVSCGEARAIIEDNNERGVTVYDVSFADPPNPEIVRGRKGFR